MGLLAVGGVRGAGHVDLAVEARRHEVTKITRITAASREKADVFRAAVTHVLHGLCVFVPS